MAVTINRKEPQFRLIAPQDAENYNYSTSKQRIMQYILG